MQEATYRLVIDRRRLRCFCCSTRGDGIVRIAWDAFSLGIPTLMPWKSRVLARALFEFAQQVTLGTSNLFPPQCPCPSTLTNHIGVSDTGGPKALLFYRSYTASHIYWSAPLVWIGHPLGPCILLIGRSVVQSCAVIFSNARLVPPLKFGHFHYSTLQLPRCGCVWISRQPLMLSQ